ncbi:rho guanine nucleotide exchange factor 39 [Onthophagus taurus]|uniref:rho guanine nucleotide exchange factor 39 n=1 Tax=Onthophagus taurus TaxID=166361 RepID=UPI0039BDFC1F
MLPSQKAVIKPCFVSLNKDLVDDHIKTVQKNSIKKKCVVFLDKDSIIETNRAQSTPHERHSIIKNCALMKSASIERNTPGRRNVYPISEPSTPLYEPALSSELRRAIDEKNLFTTKTKNKFMSALGELEEANEEENRKRYKKKAINEVLASEKAYIKQLELIFNFFEKPIREKGLLSRTNFELIFGGLNSIYKLNKELMQMLELNKLDVGSAFLKIAPFFKLYSTYAYEFKDILEVIEKSEENNYEFYKFIENQESRPEVQSKLSALLITPIQRVPRYCLLLKQILDHSKPNEDDYDDIKQSLKEVEKSAKHIDTLVEQKENSIRLVEIQTALIDHKPIIIKPGRFLIHEGPVLKIVASSVCPIYLILLNDIILFCKTKKKTVKTKNCLKCEMIYPLASCKIVEKVISRNIHISCENENVMIFIEKPKEFTKWITTLKDAQTKAVLNRMTLRKESSLRKPAHYKNLNQYNEVDLSPCVPQRKRLLNETFYKFDEEYSESPSKKFCSSKKDSLFPLRSHLLSRNPIGHKRSQSVSNSIIKDSVKVEDPDVYVFGEPSNVNRGFNFSITNFFSNIGNSLKRLFRYK